MPPSDPRMVPHFEQLWVALTDHDRMIFKMTRRQLRMEELLFQMRAEIEALKRQQ